MARVMLANASKEPPAQAVATLQSRGWWFEIKYDGVRAVVSLDRVPDAPGGVVVKIVNRNERDITRRYPDVVEAMKLVHSATGFTGQLDGEIVCFGEDGTPDFSRIHRRDAQSTLSAIRRLSASMPATFIPFDILRDGEAHTHALPYTERRALLVKRLGVERVSFASQDGETMWAFVLERGMEGLMAKNPTGMYRGGRQASWVKLRATKRISVLVAGWSVGNGPGGIRALEMALWDPQTRALMQIGTVGSGMREGDAEMVKLRLAASQPVVVEVEYLEVAPSGVLRMPVFRGIRDDVAPHEATVDQLQR
jgi:bifunctional non-homologous end joining protein LigD